MPKAKSVFTAHGTESVHPFRSSEKKKHMKIAPPILPHSCKNGYLMSWKAIKSASKPITAFYSLIGDPEFFFFLNFRVEHQQKLLHKSAGLHLERNLQKTKIYGPKRGLNKQHLLRFNSFHCTSFRLSFSRSKQPRQLVNHFVQMSVVRKMMLL